MEELKKLICLEFKILSFPYRKILAILYVWVMILVSVYMFSFRSIKDMINHQAYLISVMIWLMLGLQILSLCMSCFYEKNFRKQLIQVSNAVEACNFTTADYWVCAKTFMKFVGLKNNVAVITKKYRSFSCISRISAILLNGVILCVFVCLRAVTVENTGWAGHIVLSILIISALCWNIICSYYICCELYPGSRVTGIGLIIEYSIFLVLAQYIDQMKDIFLIFEPNIQQFWSERLEIISEFFFGTTLILTIFSILFWNVQRKGGTGIIWRRIAYYDQFADAYCGMAQSLYKIQNDKIIMEYFADTTGKKILLYENRKFMYEQFCILGESSNKLTEEMKQQFAPLLELLPAEIIEMCIEYYTESLI